MTAFRAQNSHAFRSTRSGPLHWTSTDPLDSKFRASHHLAQAARSTREANFRCLAVKPGRRRSRSKEQVMMVEANQKCGFVVGYVKFESECLFKQRRKPSPVFYAKCCSLVTRIEQHYAWPRSCKLSDPSPPLRVLQSGTKSCGFPQRPGSVTSSIPIFDCRPNMVALRVTHSFRRQPQLPPCPLDLTRYRAHFRHLLTGTSSRRMWPREEPAERLPGV
jgi:hypothetical protein